MGSDIWNFMNEQIAKVPAGSDHLVCTPWMLGERCPVSNTTTRATLYNISMEHTREHLMRAVYEGLGYNLRWIMENYQSDYGFKCENFRVIGGGGLNDPWMQIIADITGKKFGVVHDPRNAGAMGAAVVAMIGLGYLKGFDEVKNFVRVDKTYEPNPANRKIYDDLFRDYKNIYNGLKSAYEQSNGKRFTGEN